jgi:hypothetical protein
MRVPSLDRGGHPSSGSQASAYATASSFCVCSCRTDPVHDRHRAGVTSTATHEGRLYGPQHAFVLLEALLALGDLSAVAELLPTARANLAGNALLAPACDRGEGLLHAGAGRRREAARALRAAVDGFERLGVPFEAARTREQLAAVVPAAEARSLLEAAGSTYERLGAAPGHRAIRDRLLTLA